jgi:hypothetical protein
MMDEVLKVLNTWFVEERGNRVTTNNMEALVRKLNEVVEPRAGLTKGAKDGKQDNGTSG